MKKLLLTFTLLSGLSLAGMERFGVPQIQNLAPTMRQRALIAWAHRPRPSLPSWAKGPGFEAAKKWWRAGRKLSALDEKEKAAFKQLTKKVAIGSVVAVLSTLFAISTGYAYKREAKRKARKKELQKAMQKKPPSLIEQAEKKLETSEGAAKTEAAEEMAIWAGFEKNTQKVLEAINALKGDAQIELAASSAGRAASQNDTNTVTAILALLKGDDLIEVAANAAERAVFHNNIDMIMAILDTLEGDAKTKVAKKAAQKAAFSRNKIYIIEAILNTLEGDAKTEAAKMAAQQAKDQFDEVKKEAILAIEGIDVNAVKRQLE